MTKDQEAHRDSIAELAYKMIKAKYDLGQKEHKDNLWEHSIDFLLNAAIDEAVDQVVYLLTLKDNLEQDFISSRNDIMG